MKFGIVGLGTIVLILAGMAGGCGEGADLLEGTSTGKPTVVSSRATTVDGNVPLDARIEVTFDKAMNRNSITTNSDSNSCIGTHTFLLSDDDFETCVRMAGDPDVSNNYRTFIAIPKGKLKVQTSYTVKITENALSHDGIALDAPYTATFTTRPQNRVVKLEPTGSGASIESAFIATFERGMIDPTTIKTNKTEGSCDENATFLVSTDSSFSSGCIAMDATVDADAANRVFTARQANPPLKTSTDYWIKITDSVKDKEGVSIADADAALFTTRSRTGIVKLEPKGSGKSTLSAFSATFDREIDPKTIKANTKEGSCDKDATFLVSIDSSFSSGCIGMDATVDADAANRVFTARQANPPLDASTDYWIKISKNVEDKYGQTIDTTTSAFTTSEIGILQSVAPKDRSKEIPLDTNITITSKEPLDPKSIWGNDENTNCRGTLQISHDNFEPGTCVRMTEATANATNDNKTFTVDPSDDLEIGKEYQIRLAPRIKDSAGNTAVDSYITISRFTAMSYPNISFYSSDDSASAHQLIDFAFSKPMDPTTVTIDTEEKTCNANVVLWEPADYYGRRDCVVMKRVGGIENMAGVESNDMRYRFQPKYPLKSNTEYTLMISKTVEDRSKFRIGLKQDTYRKVKTAKMPYLKSYSPTHGGREDVRYRPAFKIRFDRAMEVGSVTTNTESAEWFSTCRSSSFYLVRRKPNFDNPLDCIAMSGVHFSEDKKTFTIVPKQDLDPNSLYKLGVRASIKSSQGFEIMIPWSTDISTEEVAAFVWRRPDTWADGMIAYGDDGYYRRYSPSITEDKIAGIVIDNNTGLVWQDNFSSDALSFSDASTACEKLTYNVKNDWRLPSARELFQMMSVGKGRDYIKIDSSNDFFWSSTLNHTETKNVSVSLGTNAADTAFLKLWEIKGESKESAPKKHYVCVRNNKTPSAILKQYDTITVAAENMDLVWQRSDSDKTMTGLEALKHCNKANKDGPQEAWRLPNAIELESIIKYDAGDGPFIDPKFNNRRKATYWSSTFWKDEKERKSMIAVSFKEPEINSYDTYNKNDPSQVKTFFVRCVQDWKYLKWYK